MNRIDNLQIRLPEHYANHGDYISDRVQQELGKRTLRGEGYIEQIELGSIATTIHTTADEIANEIVSRIEQQLEFHR